MKMETDNVTELKLKPMKCELNFLSKSDGSAILSQGETVVLVSVNGPLDIKTTSQSIEKATLEVLFSSKGGKPCVGDRYKENVIKQTCETAILGCLYPRTGISITIQELEDYGGEYISAETNIVKSQPNILADVFDQLVTCAVNCTCLALLNSGVAMRHMVAAVGCAVDDLGNLILEPNHEQVLSAKALLYFVFDSREKKLVTGFTEGSFSEGTYEEALARCRHASDLIFDMYRNMIAKYCDVIWR